MPSRQRKVKGSTRRRTSTDAYTVRGKPGKALGGQVMTPSAEARGAAAAAIQEVKERRPYRTRYPIPEEVFIKLKDRAHKVKLAKGKATLAADAGHKPELAATAGALRMPDIAMEPSPQPSSSASFAGIATTGWIPPDCTMASGPTHLLLAVNSSVAIYAKTGGSALLQRTLTQWFANVVQGLTIFDPKALYDQHASRWVLAAVAFKQNPQQSVFLLSVSASSDPLGQWRNYVLDAMVDGNTRTTNWADYPALGVDDRAVYLTANMFAFGGDFQYAKIRVVPKAGPYAGGPAPFFDFVNLKNPDNTPAFTVQPCHTYGAPQVEYLTNTLFPAGNSVTLWRIVNPTTAPTLTRASVPISPYSLPPNADQSGGPPPLNTGDVRVLHAVFRGDSVWATFTTTRNWGAGNRASIHWMQLRAAANSLVQEGIYGARDFHYCYPAACPDGNGNMIMVFSRSGGSEFGSICYTGRRSADSPGALQSSTLLKAGTAHYRALDDGGRNRWGDYNGVTADPAQPRVLWFYSEFAAAPDTWGTWVGSAFF